MISMVDTVTIPKKDYLELKKKALAYEKEKEEAELVNRGIESEMDGIRSGKTKTFSHDEVKEKLGL